MEKARWSALPPGLALIARMKKLKSSGRSPLASVSRDDRTFANRSFAPVKQIVDADPNDIVVEFDVAGDEGDISYLDRWTDVVSRSKINK